jgi:hypothetical protein
MTWDIYLITFLAVFFTDAIYIYFLKSVQHNRPVVAALWSVAVTFTASVAVINYTTDHFALVFALLGAFFGTLLGMKIRALVGQQN